MMIPRSRAIARWTVPAIFAVAAASTGAHAVGSISDAMTQPSARAWLVVLYGALRTGVALTFAVVTVGRAAPQHPSRNPLAFGACALAIAAVVAFAGPSTSTPQGLVLAGDLVAVAFCVWLLVSVLFLGRNFGVLPEARGLVTRGPYRLVRHPVYLGEIGACAGLALGAPSAYNAAVLAVLIFAQMARMRWEERALALAFPEYAGYAQRTPRLIPRAASLRAAHAAADDRLLEGAAEGSSRVTRFFQEPAIEASHARTALRSR
jgi:protein-S-isoprenylcysteine O-methyltransferase Ste14